MKLDLINLPAFLEFDAWIGKSSQKSNFLNILKAYENKIKNNEPNQKEPPGQFSEQLAVAAESYLGKPYDEMNCYEMVVESLEKTGFDYKGKAGVSAYLAQQAKKADLPYNNFMTGEGLVRAAGKVSYSATVPIDDSPEKAGPIIMAAISPHLEKGALLSFSMQSAGHTGFISGSNENWTYINSGRLDHNLHAGSPGKGVGEEPLMPELMNWLRRAKAKKEPLTITLGHFEPEKLMAFRKEKSCLSFTI